MNCDTCGTEIDPDDEDGLCDECDTPHPFHSGSEDEEPDGVDFDDA